jgi:restriction system protein
MTNERTLWGIHGGKTGDAEALFLKKNRIALGFTGIGDLSNLPANRDAFKERVRERFPNHKPGRVPITAGQLYRFIHELQIGDWIIFPSKRDKQVYIGEVTGQYQFNETLEPGYRHHREIKWIGKFPRTRFSQGALYEIGSALSFFQVKNYADEFIAAVEGKIPEIADTEDDETVALVAEDIEQQTADFVIKAIAKELKGKGFEHFVAHLLQRMGYRTRVSPDGTDGGIDIIAHRDELGFEPPIIKVQVKSREGNVGAPEVQALYGNISGNGEYGLFVTIAGFTGQAKGFANGKTNLRLVDGDELVTLILQHYDDFDAQYKGLIPLKRIFIPQRLEEDNG